MAGQWLAYKTMAGQVLCALLLIVARVAESVQIITEVPSTFASSLPSSPRTVIEIHDSWSTVQSPAAVLEQHAQVMTDAAGKQYHCYAPPRTAAAGPLSLPPEESAQPQDSSKTPFQLLEALSSICLYRQEGLWTYEMCYKQQTRQFRQVGSPPPGGRASPADPGVMVGLWQDGQGSRSEDFSCGKFTGDEQQDPGIKYDGSTASVPLVYVSHNMTGGAQCLLTGAGRTSEVRFTCLLDAHDNMIISVKEFPTCNYIYTVATPFLCKHPRFKPPAEVVRAINCVPYGARPAGAGKAAAARGVGAGVGTKATLHLPTGQLQEEQQEQEAVVTLASDTLDIPAADRHAASSLSSPSGTDSQASGRADSRAVPTSAATPPAVGVGEGHAQQEVEKVGPGGAATQQQPANDRGSPAGSSTVLSGQDVLQLLKPRSTDEMAAALAAAVSRINVRNAEAEHAMAESAREEERRAAAVAVAAATRQDVPSGEGQGRTALGAEQAEGGDSSRDQEEFRVDGDGSDQASCPSSGSGQAVDHSEL
ncbi:hypothetical protein QJQ45_021453 [Haematococcus lacustris]|nr:hypothetical protein QJQ45_021453 [Haematococcus lacustris]